MEQAFRSELFLGIVSPVGIDLDHIEHLIKDYVGTRFTLVHTIYSGLKSWVIQHEYR